MSLLDWFKRERDKPKQNGSGRTATLYQRGDRVRILNVDARQAKLGFKADQVYAVWVDYEDLVYLQSPVKTKTSEDYFYPNQLERA